MGLEWLGVSLQFAEPMICRRIHTTFAHTHIQLSFTGQPRIGLVEDCAGACAATYAMWLVLWQTKTRCLQDQWPVCSLFVSGNVSPSVSFLCAFILFVYMRFGLNEFPVSFLEGGKPKKSSQVNSFCPSSFFPLKRLCTRQTVTR